jgi:hypothetical protein
MVYSERKKTIGSLLTRELSSWYGQKFTWNVAAYWAHLDMTVNKISSIDMWNVKKLLTVRMYN